MPDPCPRARPQDTGLCWVLSASAQTLAGTARLDFSVAQGPTPSVCPWLSESLTHTLTSLLHGSHLLAPSSLPLCLGPAACCSRDTNGCGPWSCLAVCQALSRVAPACTCTCNCWAPSHQAHTTQHSPWTSVRHHTHAARVRTGVQSGHACQDGNGE